MKTTPSRARADVDPTTVAALRAVCLPLPQVVEEKAWVGTRWRIGRHTFAHVLMLDAGWPPAYARAAGSAGPLCLCTFRSPQAALNVHAFARRPYFRPGWWPDIVGVVIDGATNWDELGALLVQSYIALAPRRCALQLERPEA